MCVPLRYMDVNSYKANIIVLEIIKARKHFHVHVEIFYIVLF